MASTIIDKRIVVISVTSTEILNVLGAKATELGIIDFVPDNIKIKESSDVGMAFDITFEKNTV
ncbi:hypothetical protein LCGC14_2734230 [marine sediment metagenome]|uniref:Fe/B12 periplasmic-binding domain-containing protein n=1 Tax=marine sediment metagenome TaxID=412755 RepID=A0A0F8Z6E2_9ZZZZ